MLSKNEIKWIKSLHDKQQRYNDQMFVAEGSRLVLDLICSKPNDLVSLLATKSWILKNQSKIAPFLDIIKEITESQFQQISKLSSTEEVLAIIKFPTWSEAHSPSPEISLFLDQIRDPGNMGTIIRTADWFGIGTIYLSPGCVDPLNNKVIQASMSSVVRVKTIEIEIQNLKQRLGEHQFLGASLNGISYLEIDLKSPKIICLGNEANGLSSNVLGQCDQLISIPSKTLGAESLNVGIAAGILMAHFI